VLSFTVTGEPPLKETFGWYWYPEVGLRIHGLPGGLMTTEYQTSRSRLS